MTKIPPARGDPRAHPFGLTSAETVAEWHGAVQRMREAIIAARRNLQQAVDELRDLNRRDSSR